MLLSGKKEKSLRIWRSVTTSLSNAPCATPDLAVCVDAPPSSSWVTSSRVTVLTTSGPVTNMCDVSRTMKMKSVSAGEYTAPPAHGPMTQEIWEHTARAREQGG